MVEKYVSESDIRKLLQCSRCKTVPTAPPIYICKTGHQECSVCFAKFADVPRVDETDASTDSESDCASNRKEDHNIGVIFPKETKYRGASHSCMICKEEVLKTRNLLAESLLFHLDSLKNDKGLYAGAAKPGIADSNCVECCYNIYGPPCPRFDSSSMTMAAYETTQTYSRYQLPCGMQQYNYQMDPYLAQEQGSQLEYADPNVFYPEYDTGSYYNGSRREVADKRSRYNFGPQSSVVSLAGEPSKRPIRCPTHLCGRNIAVTALSSHFCFDHPDVPPFNVDFDVSSHLFVTPDMIPFNYGRCVAMLLIPNKYEPVNSVSHSNIMNCPKGKNSSLPLVVMASRLDCVTNPQTSATASFDDNSRTESLNKGDFRNRENQKTPLLVIWLAGIETNSSLFTTLQVAEKQTNIRSVVYTGPVTSLRSSQNTSKVFEQGDCLVIHSGILENIIGDRGGFDLHIVVH